jgi:hypothetical protein
MRFVDRMIDTAEFQRKRTEKVMAPWAIELPRQSTLLRGCKQQQKGSLDTNLIVKKREVYR